MEVSFTNKQLAKICNSEHKLRGKYGPRMANKIGLRLIELSDAETLEIMRSIPAARCHELTANLKDKLAVDLVHPDRLAFEPDYNEIPKKKR